MILNESHEMPVEAKTPILAQFARAIGVLILGATALFILTLLKTPDRSSQFIDRTPAILIVLGSGVLSALIVFGIGEVISLIAKIEFNTRGGKDQAILQSLHRIESALEAARREK